MSKKKYTEKQCRELNCNIYTKLNHLQVNTNGLIEFEDAFYPHQLELIVYIIKEFDKQQGIK